jgi:Sulfotransferase family
MIAMAQSFVIVACCLVLSLDAAVAISSRDCKAVIAKAFSKYKFNDDRSACHKAICGSLNVQTLRTPFMEKLSPKCQSVMQRYRKKQDQTWRYGLTQQASGWPLLERMHCSSSRDAWVATNPVVVESPASASFIMCTVPKVACSSFRKLINTIIRWPDPPEASTWDQIMKAHFDYYPTVWHFRRRTPNLARTHPSFTLGRNPYIRVLSGFLNKMVIDPTVKEDHDMYTLQDTNRALGREESKPFEATPDSFGEFLRLLKVNGAVQINDHFQQVRATRHAPVPVLCSRLAGAWLLGQVAGWSSCTARPSCIDCMTCIARHALRRARRLSRKQLCCRRGSCATAGASSTSTTCGSRT